MGADILDLLNLIRGEVSQKEYFNYHNITVIYEELPKYINGWCFNWDGINFVIINKFLSYYKKRKTILHELAHIELSQLEQIDNDLFEFKVDKYEDEADRYIKYIKDNFD